MTEERRPRGRRSLLRGIGLALLVIVAPGVATAAAEAAPPVRTIAELTGSIEYGWLTDAVAARDGVVWARATDGTVLAVPRSGAVRRYPTGHEAHTDPIGPLSVLDDGSAAVAVVPQRWRGERGPARLLRLSAGGGVRGLALPRGVAHAGAIATVGDGTTWIAQPCADRLIRVGPDGRARTLRLRPLGCRHVDEWNAPQRSAAIARGRGGVVWIANECQGRVVRVDRRGRLREWRLRPACRENAQSVVVPTRLLVERDGALRLTGVRIGAGGKVRRSAGIVVPDRVTDDGAEWTVSAAGDAVERRGPAGERTTIALGRPDQPSYAIATAALSGGRLAIVGGPLQPKPPFDWAGSFAPEDAVVATIGRDGAVTRLPSPSWPGAVLSRQLLAVAGGTITVIQEGAVDSRGVARAVAYDLGAAAASTREEQR